jgi:hypothetical protein
MPQVIWRPQWNARAPSRTILQTGWSARDQFITHYSAGPPSQTVRQIQNFHMDTNGWPDIGYNWLVTQDGTIYEGRLHNWMAVGTHAANNNTRSIGVCFIGRDADVTDQAKASIRWLYDEANRLSGKSLRKLGHRDVNPTTCPGDNLWNWVHAGMEADMAGEVADFALSHIPNPDNGANTGGHIAIGAIWSTVKLIASKVDIDAAELAAIEEAAREGAEAGVSGLDASAVVEQMKNDPEFRAIIVAAVNEAEDS